MTGEQKPGGLEVVAWRWREKGSKSWRNADASPDKEDLRWNEVQALTPAEPAEARIRELAADRALAWSDARKSAATAASANARVAVAGAKLARAVEALERIVHWRVEMTGTPVDTEAANAWAITFDAAATEASQTLAALQHEGE